ncbi:MAG: T9SS type A sorting domain-containing protein [Sediminibacterium sp.]|nr:T9SS type A sorting domain-containing protein [Sediminibacterium sp.]
MKKTIITALLFLGLSTGLIGQAPQSCYPPSTNVPIPAQPFNAFCNIPNYNDNTDIVSSQYIPTAAMPTLYYRLNFVFLIHPTQPTIFTGVTPSQISADAANCVNLLNSWFQTCGSIPSILTPPNPGPMVPNPKIQFVLNNVYFDTTTAAIAHHWHSTTMDTQFPHDINHSFNIYFYTETSNSTAGSGFPANFRYLAMAMGTPSIGATYVPGTIQNNPRLLWHELGHALGNLHDHYLPQPLNTNPAGWIYVPDDAAIDIGPYTCTLPTSASTPTNANNNLMGNSPCREVLSAKQIAAFHYLVALDITKKFTQFSNVPYPYTPPGALNNLILSGTQTYTSLPVSGYDTVRVQSGANITLQSLNLVMKQNGIVIVEKGAKLKIECSKVMPQVDFGLRWQGIEVYGDDTESQSPLYQGELEIIGSDIRGAKTAVSLGQRQSNGQFVAGSGGGIVTSTNVFFEKNYVDVEFAPYIRYQRSYVSPNVMGFAPMSNLSRFYKTRFNLANAIYPTKYACAVLTGVYGVKFTRCRFIGLNHTVNSPDYGIYSQNSSFIINRGGGGIGENDFTGIKMPIYATGATPNSNIVIDSVEVGVETNYNGIFLNNITNARITNNGFYFNGGTTVPLPTGLYLNNCTGYSVENNEFYGGPGSEAGMYVRQSGPAANSIYNNKFFDCKLGLWAVGQNYDPNTGIGLTMNCNDFTNCKYDIGIAKSGKSLAAVPNFAGVAEVQGLANTNLPTDNVRNTYHVASCIVNDENKYNINTGNSFAITSHGSFIGQQFHPTPQTNNSCSNPTELVDIIGGPALPTKVQYCPLSVFPGLSMQALNQQIGSLTQTLSAISAQQSSLIDGGNTQALMEALNNSSTAEDLRRLAMTNSPYLSDAVLNTYFTNSSVPYTDIVAVHNANKPVSPAVWQTLLNLNLPTDVMSELRTQQNVNGLSPKNQLLATQQLYSTRLGLSYNEKLSRLMSSSEVGSADSVLAIYAKNVLPNSDVLSANALIALGRYTEAKERLTAIAAKGALYADYVSIQREYIHINESPAYLAQVKADAAKREQVQRMAATPNVLSEGLAANFLEQVYGIRKPDEEKPQPETPNGSRLMYNTPVDEPGHILLNDQVLVYPNPANAVLRVTNEGSQENTLLRLLDISGKVVISQTLKGNTELNTAALNNGIYFIQLFQNDKLIAVKKVVIAH